MERAFYFRIVLKTDTVIIGQGLAGTCLALQLAQHKKDFLVVDNQWAHASSLVAAGMYNPVVFRKPSLSYNADTLVPYLKNFYSYWENEWDAHFHQERNVIKLFTSVEEENNWQLKCDHSILGQFMDSRTLSDGFNDLLFCDFGAGRALHAGNVYLDVFLNAFKTNYADQIISSWVQKVSPKEKRIVITTSEVEIQADRVIWASGHQKDGFFNHLPLGNTKGDVLTIYCPQIEGTDIINKGFFIMPLGNGFHRVGATFDWDDKSYEISKKAATELREKLDDVLKCSYTVEDQQTGLRPTVGDRRPLLGEHPELDNMFIFNGMGSKGVMLAPYYSEHLYKHIFEGSELDSEVDIKRYKKHYGNS